MNLEFSLIGWIHTFASVVALIVGGLVLIRPKGGKLHKRRGQIYVVAMLVTNITALLIYSLGIFRIFHWMAVVILLIVLVGYLAARMQRPAGAWPYIHIGSMVVSYYLLVGGAVNEAFLRVNSLRQLAPGYKAAMIGLSHAAVMVFFCVLLTYMLVIGRRRYTREQP